MNGSYTRVISTAEIPERHTGANIAERLRSTVEEWSITHVTALVHDNAANAVKNRRRKWGGLGGL